MTLAEKLVEVQSQMKAPKNLRNNFGGYNYRNAEQIFESFKPYGERLKLMLTVTDDVVAVGNAIYVKAKATVTDAENPAEHVSVTAFAREPENKKGMDSSQITGAASSYARKYALNGLFLLDDTKDADSDEYKRQDDEMAKQKKKAVDKDLEPLRSEVMSVMIEKGYAVTPRAEEQLADMDKKALTAYLNKLKTLPNKGEQNESGN